jgi:hypothetical protein
MKIEGFFVNVNVARERVANNCNKEEVMVVSDFSVGDKVEILFHKNSEYKGRVGKISFIGAGMLHGTNPLDYNIELPDQERKFIVTLEDNTLLDDVQSFQLRRL